MAKKKRGLEHRYAKPVGHVIRLFLGPCVVVVVGFSLNRRVFFFARVSLCHTPREQKSSKNNNNNEMKRRNSIV